MTSRTATLLALAIATAPALADETPAAALSAQEVLERARAAQGGAAWDDVRSMRLTGTIATGGLEGPFEIVLDVSGGRFRDAWQLGPLQGATGWDGQQAWSQDASGTTRVDGADAARQGAVSESYRRAQAWWYPERGRAEIRALGERREGDRAFQVLAIAPDGGRPFQLWVAPDGLFDRYLETIDGRVITVSFADWREVGGVRIPFTIRTDPGDGVRAHDQVVTWNQAALDVPLDDSVFALPPPPPPDFGFARARRETTVPFQVVNGHIYTDVKLNGKGPYRLLVDTGGVNIVTPAVAKALGLAVQGQLVAGGAGEKTESFGLAKVNRLEIGDAFVENQTFLVYALDRMAPVEGMREEGLIGYEIFRRFPARIDYEHGKLTLYQPESFHYRGPGAVLPFVFNEHIPQVEGEIDGLEGRFDLDTGSRSSLDLTSPFVDSHGLVARYQATTERIGGWGVGGPSRGYVVRGRRLALGPVVIRDPVVGLSTQKTGAFASSEVAGNVGYGVLSRFTLYLDYAHQQVMLEKNGRFERRDTYDKSGLWLHLVGGAFEVMEVVPGTPADEAGLREGDRILSVDGLTPARLTLHALRTLLRERPAGTRLALRVRREGRVQTIQLVLRDLV
jgi:hypothetical protein